MTRHASSYFTIAALVLVSANGCSDDTMMRDSGPRPDGSTAQIEIGTGDIGDYTTVMEGDTALLVRGSQGGQHVWVGLRAWNLDTAPALIRLLLERDEDGETVTIPFQVRLSFQDDVPAGSAFTQISGLALTVPDADDVLGRRVTLRARVSENRTGGTMADTFISNLLVDWDPDNPPGFRPGEDGGVPGDAGLRDDVGVGDAAAGDAAAGRCGGDASPDV